MTVAVATSPALATGAYEAISTAAFTAPAGSLLVAAGTGLAIDNISNSGAALTWTVQAQRSSGNQDARIWTAPVASERVGMSVTANGTGQVGGLKVWVVTGQDDTAPIGASNNGAGTANNLNAAAYNATRAGSLGFAVAYENVINAGTAGVPTSTDVYESYSMDALYSTAGGGITLRKNAVAATGGEAVAFNLNAGGAATADWIWAAVEILAPDSVDANVDLTVVEVGLALPAHGLPASMVSAGSSASPAVVAAPAAIPAPAVSTGAGAETTTVALSASIGAPNVTTEDAEIVTPATIISPILTPPPTVQASHHLNLTTIPAPVSLPAPGVRVDAYVQLAAIALTAEIPEPAVQVPILPGDNMDGDPGQIEFNGTLLGRTTSYRWKNLQGWRTKPNLDSGNTPRPTRHGSWAGRPLLQERTILWEAQLRASREQVEATVEALEQALPVEDDETEHPLVINDLGTPYLIYGRIDRQNLDSNMRLRLGLAPLVLQWVCSDPRRYNINSTGVTIPINEDRSVSNAGNIATHPLLRVHGPVTTPAVHNETLDRLVAFDVTLLAGEQLLIDCDLGTATIGGESVMDHLTGSSVHPSDWVLGRGNNVVSHSADADGVEVDVLYRDAWS